MERKTNSYIFINHNKGNKMFISSKYGDKIPTSPNSISANIPIKMSDIYENCSTIYMTDYNGDCPSIYFVFKEKVKTKIWRYADIDDMKKEYSILMTNLCFYEGEKLKQPQ